MYNVDKNEFFKAWRKQKSLCRLTKPRVAGMDMIIDFIEDDQHNFTLPQYAYILATTGHDHHQGWSDQGKCARSLEVEQNEKALHLLHHGQDAAEVLPRRRRESGLEARGIVTHRHTGDAGSVSRRKPLRLYYR